MQLNTELRNGTKTYLRTNGQVAGVMTYDKDGWYCVEHSDLDKLERCHTSAACDYLMLAWEHELEYHLITQE